MKQNDPSDTDVENERTIPVLELPKFKPHINPEDLPDLEERDKRLLLAFSVVDQKLDFVIRGLQSDNRHIRYIEAEMIRQRRWQRSMNWRMTTLVAAAVAIGTGLTAELFHVLAKQIFQ